MKLIIKPVASDLPNWRANSFLSLRTVLIAIVVLAIKIYRLKNPQQFAAESDMPAFEGKLPESSLEKLTDYLLTLKK